MKILIGAIVFIIAIYGWAAHEAGNCAIKQAGIGRMAELYAVSAPETFAKYEIEFREACGIK